jgi:hypothetical protein
VDYIQLAQWQDFVSAVVNSVKQLVDWELSLFSWADSNSLAIFGHPCPMHKFTQKDRDWVASNMFLVYGIPTCYTVASWVWNCYFIIYMERNIVTCIGDYRRSLDW